MSDLATRQETALSIKPHQKEFDGAQVATLQQMGVANADRANLAVFFHHSVRTGLDPFIGQIYMIGRNSSEWDPQRQEKVRTVKYTIQTGIDGYRLIARRAADQARVGLYIEDTLWCGPDGEWHDAWIFQDAPLAAKVVVWRGEERFSAVAVWGEYVQTFFNKSTREHVPNSMWSKMPANQLAKCAEAAALRKAFPLDLSGIYTDDEMPSAEPISADVVDEDSEVTVAPREGKIRTHRPEEPPVDVVPEDQPDVVEEPDPEPVSEPEPEPEPEPAHAEEPAYDPWKDEAPESPAPEPQAPSPEPEASEPEPTAPAAADGGGPCTRQQQDSVVILLKTMGCNSKAQANSIMSKFANREITKSADLTYDEAERFTANTGGGQ